VINKSGRGRLRELFARAFNYKINVIIQTGFHIAGCNERASCLREWSQGELQRYKEFQKQS